MPEGLVSNQGVLPEQPRRPAAVYPLGDQGVMLYFENESAALGAAYAVRSAKFPWAVDVVQAYRTVTVYYDQTRLRYEEAQRQIATAWDEHFRSAQQGAGDGLGKTSNVVHEIPCCYEMGLDVERVARHTGLTADEVIALHSDTVYTVYAIGFCPGFPYLGYLPEKLSGVPRLESPRLKVPAGSVGLTGRQTGIYTEERPGGWNILGRTPLELVNVADSYFPLRTGDRVRFVAIDAKEYARQLGRKLV